MTRWYLGETVTVCMENLHRYAPCLTISRSIAQCKRNTAFCDEWLRRKGVSLKAYPASLLREGQRNPCNEIQMGGSGHRREFACLAISAMSRSLRPLGLKPEELGKSFSAIAAICIPHSSASMEGSIPPKSGPTDVETTLFTVGWDEKLNTELKPFISNTCISARGVRAGGQPIDGHHIRTSSIISPERPLMVRLGMGTSLGAKWHHV